MKTFKFIPNVKLLRGEKLYSVRGDFSKCKPWLNDISFVYLPIGYIWIDLWELMCFLSPSHTKNMTACLQKETRPQSFIRLLLVVIIRPHLMVCKDQNP